MIDFLQRIWQKQALFLIFSKLWKRGQFYCWKVFYFVWILSIDKLKYIKLVKNIRYESSYLINLEQKIFYSQEDIDTSLTSNKKYFILRKILMRNFVEIHGAELWYKLMLKEFRIQSYIWITFLFFSSFGWRLLSLFLRRWCISAKTVSSWLQPTPTSCWVPCSSSRKGYSSIWDSTFLLSPWI